ncbi:hypothetical protein D9M69_478560 [compost metagenome]
MGGQAVIARLGGQLGALPALGLGELAAVAPHLEQHVAGVRLRFAYQPELLGGGVTLGFLAVAQLVLAVQAVQLGEVHLRVVVVDEGLPLAALGQPAQPAQFHPVGLRQVAVFGEEFLDLGVAGELQPGGQLVVGQVRFQRVIGKHRGVAPVGGAVALGQGALGLGVVEALLGQAGGLGGAESNAGEDEAGEQAEQATAHGTSGIAGRHWGMRGGPASNAD